MTNELRKVAALQRERYITVTDRELRLLHWCVDKMEQSQMAIGQESLELKDLEARLATAIELPVDGIEYREGLVALLPEHLLDAARRLIVYNPGDEHVAVAVWCEEDIFDRAKERGIKVTREQAQWVVRMLDDEQDCSMGISWDTIDCYLDELVAQGKAKEKEDDDDDNS